MTTEIEKKQKIHAPAVKKCLNKIFGFVLPCRKCWAEMAEAFPQETFTSEKELKTFLRQYVWLHAPDHKKLALRFQDPFPPPPLKKSTTKKRLKKRFYKNKVDTPK